MKTYKVTYFDSDMDVFTVQTYHNVEFQSDLLYLITSYIYVQEISPVVKVVSNDGVNYSSAVNEMLNYELDSMCNEKFL